jgi:hypothetical protein
VLKKTFEAGLDVVVQQPFVVIITCVDVVIITLSCIDIHVFLNKHPVFVNNFGHQSPISKSFLIVPFLPMTS